MRAGCLLISSLMKFVFAIILDFSSVNACVKFILSAKKLIETDPSWLTNWLRRNATISFTTTLGKFMAVIACSSRVLIQGFSVDCAFNGTLGQRKNKSRVIVIREPLEEASVHEGPP